MSIHTKSQLGSCLEGKPKYTLLTVLEGVKTVRFCLYRTNLGTRVSKSTVWTTASPTHSEIRIAQMRDMNRSHADGNTWLQSRDCDGKFNARILEKLYRSFQEVRCGPFGKMIHSVKWYFLRCIGVFAEKSASDDRKWYLILVDEDCSSDKSNLYSFQRFCQIK